MNYYTKQINSIGIIKTSFENKAGVPIQAAFGKAYEGKIILFPQFQEALKDLEEISHIYLIYSFNRHDDMDMDNPKMKVIPYMDDKERGLFATRVPIRPSGLGLSIVEIIKIEGCEIFFRGVDMLNNTPLLDIKPYVPEIDSYPDAKAGWYDLVKNKARLSDDRF